MKFLAIAALLFVWIAPATAKAAQDATVIVDNAIIRAEPKEGSEVLEYLPIGTEVRVSSYPIEGGWYKIRSRTGEYGWMQVGYLSVSQIVSQEKEEPNPEMSEAPQPKEKIARVIPVPIPDRKFFVRGHFGFQFQQATDINAIFSFSEFKTAKYAGGEIGYFVSNDLAALFRMDTIFQDVVAKESITGVTFNLGVRSYPIMVGAEYYLIKIPPMRLSIGAYGGLALSTSFTAQAVNLSAPNTLTIEDSPFTAMVKVNLTRPLGRTFSVFAEANYRVLTTAELSTEGGATMNGGQVFLKNNAYQNRIIDLSGFDLGAGLGVHF